jgi:hypothetical protein
LEELAARCQRVATQIEQRLRGERISDRLVSLADPDARPVRKGKPGKPGEFGYVAELAEVTANTRRGARGDVLPAATAPGNPGENRLLDQTAAELTRLGLAPREVALDGGLCPARPRKLWPRWRQRVRSSPGGPNRAPGAPVGVWPATAPAAKGAQPPQARLRAAAQPPEGERGQRIWTGWAVLTTTWTPWPSTPVDRSAATQTAATQTKSSQQSGPTSPPPVYPEEVANQGPDVESGGS